MDVLDIRVITKKIKLNKYDYAILNALYVIDSRFFWYVDSVDFSDQQEHVYKAFKTLQDGAKRLEEENIRQYELLKMSIDGNAEISEYISDLTEKLMYLTKKNPSDISLKTIKQLLKNFELFLKQSKIVIEKIAQNSTDGAWIDYSTSKIFKVYGYQLTESDEVGVVRSIKKLEKGGLIETKRPIKRVTQIKLTQEGKARILEDVRFFELEHDKDHSFREYFNNSRGLFC